MGPVFLGVPGSETARSNVDHAVVEATSPTAERLMGRNRTAALLVKRIHLTSQADVLLEILVCIDRSCLPTRAMRQV